MQISELIKKLEQFPATENIVAITSNDCFIGPMQAEPDVYFSKSEKKFFIGTVSDIEYAKMCDEWAGFAKEADDVGK